MNKPIAPMRGFPVDEYQVRIAKAQALMQAQNLGALLVMTEPEIAYFAGFRSYFWQSPTRPWFLVVPAKGAPIAVIPSIGLASFQATWVEDIRVWASPNPLDEGVSLLAETLKEACQNHRTIGLPMGPETHLRMPANDVQSLRDQLGTITFKDATGLISGLRMVKSEREIEKHAYICSLVSNSFDALPRLYQQGMTERDVFSKFRLDVLARGADSLPYLICASGAEGVDNAIGLPTDRPLDHGDMIFIDVGAEIDGYYSDFDRNFAIGHASDAAQKAYRIVHRAVDAGIKAAKPGKRASDIWQAMAYILAEGGADGNAIGRMGHGVGLRNTEWPSIMQNDDTVLQAGMVMAIEPGLAFGDGKLMLHEENIVVREGEAQRLSRRAPPELPLLK